MAFRVGLFSETGARAGVLPLALPLALSLRGFRAAKVLRVGLPLRTGARAGALPLPLSLGELRDVEALKIGF